jgi:hypothetical protein
MDTLSGTPQAYPSTPGLSHLTAQAEGQTMGFREQRNRKPG